MCLSCDQILVQCGIKRKWKKSGNTVISTYLCIFMTHLWSLQTYKNTPISLPLMKIQNSGMITLKRIISVGHSVLFFVIECVWQYRKTYNDIGHTVIGNKLVDYSDVIGASPVGADPAIFILDSTFGFIGSGKDNGKTRQETFQFWYLVRPLSEVWQYVLYVCFISFYVYISLQKHWICGNTARDDAGVNRK